MAKALDLLKKASNEAKQGSRHIERRLGKKPGDVKTRTIIGGRSYDHVETGRTGERELHPTNIVNSLGTITETGARTHIARSGDEDLGEHVDAHKAARSVVSHKRKGTDFAGGLGHAGGGDSVQTDASTLFNGPMGAGNSRSTTSVFV